jgi:alkylation response protein AidB-like acyl-CoA dehydrogenase
MTADYVKTRKQFDRAIGTFQAVQHKLADCYLQLEQLEALALFAAWAAESDPAQFYSAVAACKGLASAEVPRIIETTVQVHGGIGFTYEYDLHLLLRRARVVSSLFGGEGQWFEELASLELTGPP